MKPRADFEQRSDSAIDNDFPRSRFRNSAKNLEECRFACTIAFAEIEKFLDTPVKRYSSGMYVRLAFSVAAHLDPEILVVDEVLAVGDAAFQAKCLGKLANVAGEGRTILFVSHNMTAVSNLCSRAILMANGSICCEGNASDIIESYTLVGRQLAQKDLTHRNDRTGRGHVRLSSIRTMDTDSRERIVFPTGADVLVDLEYKSALQQPLRRVSVALNVRNSLGSIVFSCWNEMSGDHFDEMPPNGHLVCNISSIPLPCGTYALDANVSVNRELADKISDIGSFTIEGGDYFGTGKVLQQKHGQVFVKHRWWTHA